MAPRRPDIAFATNRLARSLAKPSKSDIIASKRLSCDILRGTQDLGLKRCKCKTERGSTLTVFTDSDWGWRSTHAQVRVFVGSQAGWILEQCRCPNTVSDLLNRHVKLSTSRPPQPRVKRSTSRLCSWLGGQHVNIHLRSDSSGAIGAASRRALQRLRHLDARFLWLQAETASKEHSNQQGATLKFCRSKMGATQRSRISFVMPYCNKFITICMSLCHRS